MKGFGNTLAARRIARWEAALGRRGRSAEGQFQ